MLSYLTNYKLLNHSLKTYINNLRLISSLSDSNATKEAYEFLPNLDFNYLCSPENTSSIKCSINNRKVSGDIDKVLQLYKEFLQCSCSKKRREVEQNLVNEALKIPNKPHPIIQNLKSEPSLIKTISNSKHWSFKPKTFDVLAKKLKLIKTENLTNLVGPRSYFLIDGLAELEDALIEYSLNYLWEHKFQLISVPDLLPRTVIEYSGMDTRGERTQVYNLNSDCGKDVCLSGTAEMGIAQFLQGKEIGNAGSVKLAAVSRCYRAETSKISVEKGIYRVHQFTKVEMFGITDSYHSDTMLDEFCSIQESLFSKLGLDLRVLDMPECDLGAQAYRKFDIECFMPGKKHWGELSSASNCTDYQSRRLGIKFEDGTFAHTINGTACAVPRLLIAILETYQNKDGTISIPEVLIPFMGRSTIEKSKLPTLFSFKVT